MNLGLLRFQTSETETIEIETVQNVTWYKTETRRSLQITTSEIETKPRYLHIESRDDLETEILCDQRRPSRLFLNVLLIYKSQSGSST